MLNMISSYFVVFHLRFGSDTCDTFMNYAFRDKPMIVPYRDSKLTRLFQSYFNGHGKACMVVNVNQCASMFDETLHALKYSAVAKQVRTGLGHVCTV